MNKEFEEFIKRNSIDINAIYDDLKIYSEQEINIIISDNKLETEGSKTIVSIADIIGYEYEWRGQTGNLINNFSSFFSNESSYQRRSLGMLKYSSDEVIGKLSRSFESEPIRVLELDGGRKVISENGLHRYTILRIHYINELQKVKGDKEKEEQLRKKYEIPVHLKKVDLFKTYCQFLIKTISISRVYLSNNYDDHWNRTGKIEISENGEVTIVNDEELLRYTKEKIKAMPSGMYEWFLNHVKNCCEAYESFKKFIDTYFPEIMTLITEKNNKNIRGGL